MIRLRWQTLGSGRAFREARPLLVAMTLGFSLALVLSATAAWRPDLVEKVQAATDSGATSRSADQARPAE